MLELIAILIFLLGLGGMTVMFISKLPEVAALPRTTQVLEEKDGEARRFVSRLVAGAKALPVVKGFSLELFLQKVLSRFRILALKIDHQTALWLEALRKKSQENGKAKEGDTYWDELGRKNQ